MSKDFESSAPACNGIESYIDLPAQPGGLRFADNTNSSMHVTAIEGQPSHLQPNLFPHPILPPANLGHPSPYNQEPYYSDPHQLMPRLGFSTRPPSMASHSHHGHHHRATASSTISVREQYAGDIPTFRRPSEHKSRSPSYSSTLRRQPPLSPAPSPTHFSPLRMDTAYGVKASGPVPIPPLGPMITIGQLEYVDGNNTTTPIRCDINGAIDKGFFLAHDDWTCYRRNYFSCTCSFTLTPSQYPGAQIRYIGEDDIIYPVRGFLMTISAVVADENGQSIELVQHTPKRDKGPTTRPSKVALHPKPPMAPQALAPGMYHPHDPTAGLVGPSRGPYDPTTGFPNTPQGPGSFPTEYSFERIQFKQATANNGKRRAAQQYYHLCIELWAECDGNLSDPYVKVAFRKSAKMIVRGRSPGHYSDNRRNGTSNGRGGSAGSLGGYPTGSIMGADFQHGGAGLPGGGFTGSYEPRGGAPPPPSADFQYRAIHGARALPQEAYVSPEADKAIHTTRDYQYFPGPIYEGQQDSRHPIAMFTHATPRTDDGNMMIQAPIGPVFDSSSPDNRVKSEGEGGNGHHDHERLFHPGPAVATRRCEAFEGKHSSSTWYPTSEPPASSSHSQLTP